MFLSNCFVKKCVCFPVTVHFFTLYESKKHFDEYFYINGLRSVFSQKYYIGITKYSCIFNTSNGELNVLHNWYMTRHNNIIKVKVSLFVTHSRGNY